MQKQEENSGVSVRPQKQQIKSLGPWQAYRFPKQKQDSGPSQLPVVSIFLFIGTVFRHQNLMEEHQLRLLFERHYQDWWIPDFYCLKRWFSYLGSSGMVGNTRVYKVQLKESLRSHLIHLFIQNHFKSDHFKSSMLHKNTRNWKCWENRVWRKNKNIVSFYHLRNASPFFTWLHSLLTELLSSTLRGSNCHHFHCSDEENQNSKRLNTCLRSLNAVRQALNPNLQIRKSHQL